MVNKNLLLKLLKKSHKLTLEYKETLYDKHNFFKDDCLLSFNDEFVKNIQEDYDGKIKINKTKEIKIFSNGIKEETIKITERFDYEKITTILKNNIDEFFVLLCLDNNIDYCKFSLMLDIIDDKYEVYVDDSFEFFIHSSLNYNLKKGKFFKEDNGSILINILNFLTNNNIIINKESLNKINTKTKKEIEDYEKKFEIVNNFYDINGGKLTSCPKEIETFYNEYYENDDDEKGIKIIKTIEVNYYENGVIEEKEIDVLKFDYNNIININNLIIEEFFTKWSEQNNININKLKKFLKIYYSDSNGLIRNYTDFKEFITYGLEYDLNKECFIYEGDKINKILKILKYALKEFKNN